jgi:hypothetical protein
LRHAIQGSLIKGLLKSGCSCRTNLLVVGSERVGAELIGGAGAGALILAGVGVVLEELHVVFEGPRCVVHKQNDF